MSEPGERHACAVLGHSQILTQAYVVFASLGDNTNCSVSGLHLPNVIRENVKRELKSEYKWKLLGKKPAFKCMNTCNRIH